MKLTKEQIGYKKKAGYFLYCIVAILCIGYIVIAFNNRYQFDDIAFYVLVRDNGLWKAFVINFFTWETTFNTIVLFGLLKWIDVLAPYIYNVSFLLINIYCFFLLLRTIIENYKIEISIGELWLISVLVITISYFSCRAMGNAVYWVTGQIFYCLFMSYLFLAIHFWIKQKLVLASVFMFLFAHTRINYDAIFIGLYSSYLFFCWFKNKSFHFNWKLQIPFIFFLIGIVSYVIIPGNYNRVASIKVAGPEVHLSVLIIMKGWISAFKHLAGILFSSWKQLIIFPIGIMLSFYLSHHFKLKELVTLRLLIYCSIAFIISYIGQSTVIYIAIKTPVGYGRIFFMLEMLLFMLILMYGVYFGNLLQSYTGAAIVNSLIYITSFSILFAVAFSIYTSYQTTAVFARAYDKRIQYLKDLKQTSVKGKVYVSALPSSDVLEFMEISPETDSLGTLPDNNAVYVKYYRLPFKLFLEK